MKNSYSDVHDIILALVKSKSGAENALFYAKNGYCLSDSARVGRKDLFIVTPEPELTEFENELVKMLMVATGKSREFIKLEAVKETAIELLDLARKEFVKQGYVIEKKTFHDAVEKIDDRHKAEMCVEYSLHCKVENGTRHAIMNWNEFQKVAQKFIDDGKAEALKDLPRWERLYSKEKADEIPDCIIPGKALDNRLVHRGFELKISDLEKLPGFKEDESHE